MDQDKSGLRLFRVYHDETLLSTYKIPDDGIRVPYYTGDKNFCNLLSEFNCLIDPDLDLSGAEFAGIEHYRRVFDEITPETAGEYVSKIGSSHCWIYPCVKNYRRIPQLTLFSMQRYNDVIYEYIRKNAGAASAFFWKKDQSRSGRGMCIMDIERFNAYRNFLSGAAKALMEFDGLEADGDPLLPCENTVAYLKEHGKDPVGFLTNFAARMYGYMLERIGDIWVQTNMVPLGMIGRKLYPVAEIAD